MFIHESFLYKPVRDGRNGLEGAEAEDIFLIFYLGLHGRTRF